jgi:hypothetical protein
MASLEAGIQQATASLAGEIEACTEATPRSTDDGGERDKAKWDIAAADSIEDTPETQEWQIRRSLADEIGILPSEVDWRGIYESRAEKGRSTLKRLDERDALRQAERKLSQQDACAAASRDRQTIKAGWAAITKLKEQR